MSLIGKFASVGGATMASRVLGFVREAMIAALLGAGPVADAFYAAFRFPNLFRRIFAEGAFNAAFVPLFSKEVETGGNLAAREFAEQVLSFLLLILLLLSGLAMVFMPFLVGTIIAPKFSAQPEKFELTVLLTRIMFPYLAAMSLVAMLAGVLNTFRRYFLAALAPVMLNVVLVTVLAWSAYQGITDRQLGIAMAIGVTFSGVVQLLLLIYGVHRQGFPLALRMPRLTVGVKRVLVLALPTAIAGGITQVNLLIGQIIASAQEGAISIINYADRLMQLPLGIIGISIGVVLLPELTRALAAEEQKEAQRLQNRSLEFGLGLTVPAAVGLLVIPLPIIALIYERGAFVRETSEITASVLAAFAIGLPSFVLIKILQPAFYAREDMTTPMVYAALNAISNVILAFMLFPVYGVVGLGIATSAAGWINAALLLASLTMRGQFRPDFEVIKNIAIIVVASALMACLLWAGQQWLGAKLTDNDLLPRLMIVFGLIVASAVFYFAIVVASGAVQAQQVKRLVWRK